MYLVKFRSVWATLFLAFVLAVLATPARAVDVNARIKGTVTDPSGAVLPGRYGHGHQPGHRRQIPH